MSNLLILGAGGHGKVVAEIAQSMNLWNDISFVDDNEKLKEVNGYKVIDKLRNYKLYKKKYKNAFVAIGDNKLRMKLIDKLISEGFNIPLLIHSFTAISNNTQIGKGTIIMPGVIINTNTVIGKGCIINTSASIDHDCVLNEGVHISPGVHIGGTTQIGRYTWICIGASISNNIKIGDNSIIASGTTVINDIKDYTLVGGTPARIIKEFK